MVGASRMSLARFIFSAKPQPRQRSTIFAISGAAASCSCCSTCQHLTRRSAHPVTVSSDFIIAWLITLRLAMSRHFRSPLGVRHILAYSRFFSGLTMKLSFWHTLVSIRLRPFLGNFPVVM